MRETRGWDHTPESPLLPYTPVNCVQLRSQTALEKPLQLKALPESDTRVLIVYVSTDTATPPRPGPTPLASPARPAGPHLPIHPPSPRQVGPTTPLAPRLPLAILFLPPGLPIASPDRRCLNQVQFSTSWPLFMALDGPQVRVAFNSLLEKSSQW